MKITEIINEEVVGVIHTGKYVIKVDNHALDRALERGVDVAAVDYILRRLDRIANKLEKIEPGEQFWIYDWSRELSLGIRRISATPTFLLKTVYPEKPSRTPNVQKIIYI